MTTKDFISRLKNMAELASASYGYFDLYLEQQSKTNVILLQDDNGKEIKNEHKQIETKQIEITDVLNIKYKNHRVAELVKLGEDSKAIPIGTLKGDFTPTQIQNFFHKYDLLEHQANTYSGFSATLFQDNSGI